MLLEGGEIDLTAMPIELEDIKALMQEKGITCRSDPTILFYMISLKYTEAGETGSIMSNPKVRQALSYAFNYDSVLENILGLKGTPIKNTIFLPSLEGYDPDAAAYTFDLDKARELLAEAGYPDGGFDLDLMWLAVFPEFTQIAELYQSDLAKLGINLTIHGEQPATFIDQIASPDTTPDLVLRPRAPSNLSWSHLLDWTPQGFPPNSINEGYYDNAEFNQLVEAAKGELDPDARAELIRQAVQVMHDDPAGIWIAAINDVMCFTDTLSGLSHEPHYLYVYWPHDLYREQ
jgi:peptide/nickel transport system substrate-binding protein